MLSILFRVVRFLAEGTRFAIAVRTVGIDTAIPSNKTRTRGGANFKKAFRAGEINNGV
jgi:hypothetical protein